MAIDTFAKLKSAASWLRGVPGMGGYGPEPDAVPATIDDLVDMAGDYRGVPPGDVVVGDGANSNLLLLNVG